MVIKTIGATGPDDEATILVTDSCSLVDEATIPTTNASGQVVKATILANGAKRYVARVISPITKSLALVTPVAKQSILLVYI